MGRLDGRVAIVTGAGRGIGKGIAVAFAKEGADVCVAELDAETGPATAKELEVCGVRAMATRCDVSQRDQVEATVAAAVKELGGIDILVNNATGATMDSFKPLIEHTEAMLDRQFAVDVKGTFLFMTTCFPHMCARGGGKIINLGSLAGSERTIGYAAYSAGKEAVRALTGVAAREWGEHGINVNAICPTALSPGVAQFLADHPEQEAEARAGVPLRRLGDPELDIGRVVAFLASDEAGFITGQTFWIDGGSVIHS